MKGYYKQWRSLDRTLISFGLDKCAKATFKRQKLTGTTSIELDWNTVIKCLEQEEVFKYFFINESKGTQHTAMKDKIQKVLPASTSNPEDRKQLCKSYRSNKYFGSTCCNV